MAWLGLDYDEGPIYQTDRFDRYFQVADHLLESGQAYRCECSKARLDELREGQMQRGEKPRYDGHCRDKHLTKKTDGTQVVRFRTPTEGSVSWIDGVRGEIQFNNEELDDLIMIRSDGTPTYNFCVVVDDIDMEITHVIRGEDHVNNTPRQIHLYWALGKSIPHFSHVPSILGSDGKKLSKRHGALSVMEYRQAGFLPEALMNYLVRLGWSFKDEEIFSREEIIQKFSLDSVSRSPAAFNMEKLLWLNQHYLKTLPIDRIQLEFEWHLGQSQLLSGGEACSTDPLLSGGGEDLPLERPSLNAVLKLLRERVKTVQELVEQSRYFYEPVTTYDPAALEKVLKDGQESVKSVLQAVHEKLSVCEWGVESIHVALNEVATERQIGMGKIGMPLRLALTGGLQSPSIDATSHVLGRQVVLDRIARLVERL
jgi:glutamyl-tRNA synthetase